ncbi:MAG: HAMP domain-containing protein [Firmicutes bacterium]|nr:HAMP domain-containing protein [Bacillota bacterium]
MLKKISRSLTTRIFIITLSLLILISGITYALIWFTMPVSYRTELDNYLETQVSQLIDQLQSITFEESSQLFDRFLMDSNATLLLRLPDNTLLVPPSNVITENSPNENVATSKETEDTVFIGDGNGFTNAEYDLSKAKEYPFSFTNSNQEYTLIVIGETKFVNQVTATLLQILPWVIVAIVCISLFAAFFYSHYITKPIVSISALSKKMANMDLNCRCAEGRNDEIGVLANSLNELALNLAKALGELKSANLVLQQDIDKERELDRQRMIFFSAVSHELKTPITALQGQLEGMLQNYGSYRDRDKYLAKSLAITKSMEYIIQEIVTISRLDAQDYLLNKEYFDFSELIREVTAEYIDLIDQKELELDVNISDQIMITADKKLIEKVLSNLFSNAVRYSPMEEKVSITAFYENGRVHFSILNTGVQISEEALPHLFEVFYRADSSRSRQTGGSGLGLYIVKRILEQHKASFSIHNQHSGVEFSFIM